MSTPAQHRAPGQLTLLRFPTLRDQLGLHPTPAGAERLLAALVRHGLPPEQYMAAARLVLELEREAAERDAADLEEAS